MRDDITEKLRDPLRLQLERRALVIFLLSSTFSLAFLERGMAWGVVTGGGVAWFSFRSLRRTLERGFSFILSGQGRVGGFVAIRYYLKLAVIFLLLAYLLREGKIEALGLATGLLVVPVSLIYTGIIMYLSNRGGKTR